MAPAKFLGLSIMFLGIGFLAAMPPAQAAEKATSVEVETLRKVNLARQIIQLGMEDKDPLALIVAARIFREIPPIEGPPPKKIDGNLATDRHSDKEVMSLVLDRSVGNLLKKAREFAGERQDVLGLIDDVAEMSPRGAGGIVHLDHILGGKTDTYEITYEGMKPAALYIEAQGDADLDLSVQDKAGNEVCKDARRGVTSMCEWMPKQTEPFVIKVMNTKDQDIEYILLTN